MSATLLKQGRLETALVGRGLEGFQQRVEVELQLSGVIELDAVRWRFSARVSRGIVRPRVVRADEPGFVLAGASYGTAGSMRVRRCFGFSRPDFSRGCGSGTASPALDSMWRNGGPRTGSQEPFLLCSCGQGSQKNLQSRFCEQKATASTWLATSARTDARSR